MSVRLIMVAAAMMSAAAVASAEPTQPDERETSQPRDRSAELIMASADQPPSAEGPSADTPAPSTAPKRVRAARVTTCRCGDPG